MAFTGRGHPFDVSPDTAWSDPALDDANARGSARRWRSSSPTCCPAATSTSFPTPAREVTRASYGDAKLERLGALKRAWDPSNVFRLNHNIEPTSG